MHAERIDGYNPLAVIDAYARKKEIIERGEGPILLDTVTYRYSGHSPSDASSYREKSEIDEWRQVDSLITYREDLIESGVATSDELDKMQQQIDGQINDAYVRAIDLDLSPRADLYAVGSLLERTMFSNSGGGVGGSVEKPDVLLLKEANPRVKQLASRSRSGIGENGELLAKGKSNAIRDD